MFLLPGGGVPVFCKIFAPAESATVIYTVLLKPEIRTITRSQDGGVYFVEM
jgi:hypothetical protein